MADKGSFQIGVSVVDKATDGLKKLNAELAAMQKPAKEFNKAASRFSDLTGLTKVMDAFDSVGSAAVGATKKVAGVGLEVAGLGGVASIAGIAALTAKWSDWGNEVAKTSDWLGISHEKVIEMSQMSKMLGAAPDAMAKSFENVADMARSARLGLDPQAMQLFGTLHITDAANETDKAMDQIIDTARKLKAEGRSADVRALYKAFGLSPDLIRAIETTSQSWSEMHKKAEESAKKLEPAAEAAQKFHDAISSLGIQLEGTLGEALTPFANEMAEWLSNTENQKWIIDEFNEGLHKVKEYFQEAAPHLKKMWDDAGGLNGVVGDLKAAFEALVAVKVMTWAGDVVVALGTIDAAIRKNPRLWTLLSIAQIGLQAYESMKDPNSQEDYDERMSKLSPDSPMWQGIPEADQQRFPNSPLSRKNGFHPPRGPQVETKELQAKEQNAFNYLTNDLHVPENQAKGIIAGAVNESGLDPNAVSKDGYAMKGLLQWDTSRRANYRSMFGHDIDDPTISDDQKTKEQLKFAWQETNGGSETSRGKRFLDASNPEAAARYYSTDVIRPADAEGEAQRRADLAGHLHVTVEHVNPPPGAGVAVQTSGPAFNGPPPQVVTSMPDYGAGSW